VVQDKQDQLFLDRERGGYFTSQEGDEFIVIRLKEDQVEVPTFYAESGSRGEKYKNIVIRYRYFL